MAERCGFLDTSGPGLCVPRPRVLDILELTNPHRQRDHCTMPTQCSPRPAWCLQMRTWDPDWSRHLAKAKQTERNVGLESAAQRSHHCSGMFLEQNTVTSKNAGVKSSHCNKLNAPVKPQTLTFPRFNQGLGTQARYDCAMTWWNVASKGSLVHLRGDGGSADHSVGRSECQLHVRPCNVSLRSGGLGMSFTPALSAWRIESC